MQLVQAITTRLILAEFSVITVQKRFQIGERMCSSQPSPSRASLGTASAAGVLSNKTSKLQLALEVNDTHICVVCKTIAALSASFHF